MTKRVSVTSPVMDMRVFHEEIYKGKEPMKVVGIRKTEVELEGDYSGGTHAVSQKSWMPIKGLFEVRKVCPEHAKPNGCQLHNLHCSYPDCEKVVDFEEE